MTEVVNTLKDRESCGCGCQLYGTLRKKAWSNGQRCVRGCKCRRCVGGRQTGKARKRENRIARELGLERSVLSGALNGADLTGYLDIEETANVALVAGLRRWYQSKQVQTKLARLYARGGDAPKAFGASWDGRPQLMVIEYSDGARLALAASQEPEASLSMDCPMCGHHRVKVVGDTTQHFEPVGCHQIVDDHELCDREVRSLRRIVQALHPDDAPDPLTARLIRDEVGEHDFKMFCDIVAGAPTGGRPA